MNKIITDNQLWLSGTSSEIRVQLRRMMMKAGKDAKMCDVLQQANPRKPSSLSHPHSNTHRSNRSRIR